MPRTWASGSVTSGVAAALSSFSPSSRRTQLNGEGHRIALAEHLDRDLGADRGVGNDARQVAHLMDRLVVEFHHHIARLDAGLLGRAGRRHIGNKGAARHIELQ